MFTTDGLAAETLAFAKKHAKGLKEEMKWGAPTLLGNAPVLYVVPHRTHVNLGFHKGAELADKAGLLEGTGTGMRHVKIRDAADLDARVAALVKEAVAHDAKVGARPPKGWKRRAKAKSAPAKASSKPAKPTPKRAKAKRKAPSPKRAR